MTRRLVVLLALLIAPLGGPSVAAAEHRHDGRGPGGGGASAAVVAQIDTDDPTGGAHADEVPVPVLLPVPADGGDVGVPAPPVPPPTVRPAPAPGLLVPVPSTRRTVPGRVARIRTDGRAAIPRGAPKAVKRVLAAANLIVGKPYKWGGGHARLVDTGYDCSGTVSYALIRAGLLPSSLVSGGFARWAAKGDGRWISIHANAGHVYMEVAGLRLDTSRVGDPGGSTGVRWRPAIGRRTGFVTRHVTGL